MSFCPKCGTQLGQDFVFCGECGFALAATSGGPPSGATVATIDANVAMFKYRAHSRCSTCSYEGAMGCDGVKMPISLWIALPLCLLGLIPGLIVSFINLKRKCYKLQCPRCGQLMLKPAAEAVLEKNAIGGAKSYTPSNSQRIDWSKAQGQGSSSSLGTNILIGGTVAVVLLVVFAIAASSNGSGTTQAKDFPAASEGSPLPSAHSASLPEADVVKPRPIEKYEATELIKRFVENAIAAEQELKDQVVEVHGTISEMGKDDAEIHYVALSGDPDDPMRIVKCSFKPELASTLVSLKVGGSVTLSGTVVGFTTLKQGDLGVAQRVEMAPCSVRQQPPTSVVEPITSTQSNE